MNGIVAKQENLPVVAEAVDETASLIGVIERAARDPSVDVAKMERLMEMAERVQAKKAEVEFNKAMNQAQSEIRRVGADAENPQTRSKYATYAALDRMLRPVYTQHGFSLSFDTGESAADFVKVLCYVSHQSGHTRTYQAVIPADGKGAKGGDVMTKTHAVGSGMSYGMRYLLKMIFNVAVGEDDDDGNSTQSIERVSEEQVADLECLLTEVGANKDGFLKWLSQKLKMKIGALADIPSKAYQDAVSGLESKRKAQPK